MSNNQGNNQGNGKKKNILVPIIVLAICGGLGVAFYMNDPVKISYKGDNLNAESPIKEDGEYMIPAMSVLNEVFDADLRYDYSKAKVEGKIDGDKVLITAGSKTIEIDGEEFKLDSPPIIESNVLYMPADGLEHFDLSYSYNVFTKTLEIKD